MSKTSIEAKVVVLGSQGVGKTSVILRYVGEIFSRQVSPTIGASFFTCKMAVNDGHVTLQIWDTAGQERFRSMAPLYYRNANAAFLVFDITNYESFLSMKDWVTELQRNVEEPVVMCIMGNKIDLCDSRAVDESEAFDYASSIGAMYFETSAVTFEGIEAAFLQIAIELLNVHEMKAATDDSMNISSMNKSSCNGLRLSSESSKGSDENYEHTFFCC